MTAKRFLVCWIGNTDLKASRGELEAGQGPIGKAVAAYSYDQIVLLCDYAKPVAAAYVKWLQGLTASPIELCLHKLPSPIDFGAIYDADVSELTRLAERHGQEFDLVFHLSPGTPAMAAVWILLAKTRFPAELIESSKEHGVRTAHVPFDISAEFIPGLLRRSDRTLERLAQGLPEEAPEFADILHRSPQMKDVIRRAQRVAVHSIPVLIEGESGTGKELLARAIHRASPRASKPFVAVNCGAIPPELFESEFFGHKKGSFSGAVTDRQGHFETADGGTLFLDEIGELPKPIQVKLLRALQEDEVVRVGDSTSRKVEVRIIAATNRTLTSEIATGNFREDLFFRLAVAIIKLPPLRERAGDLTLLIDELMKKINVEASQQPGYKNKIISVDARNLLLRHAWSGNVRELLNTLQRAAVWSEEETIDEAVMGEAILDLGTAKRQHDDILYRPVEEGVDLKGLLDEVAQHYLTRAHSAAHGNKARMARLLGFKHYQTLTNWLDKYGLA